MSPSYRHCMATRTEDTMNSRHQVFALASVLTATALTGGVAIAGLTHTSAHPAPPAKSQVVQPPAAPAFPAGHEPGEVD
jgi:hypothetical protein